MKSKKYRGTYLKKMDDVKRSWYMNAMKIWKKKDYENYTKFYLWMFGDLWNESQSSSK